jgi:hypothetical protein
MTAWVLTDGAAGNLRQARALADAMASAYESIELRTHAPWRWTAPRLLIGAEHAFGAGFRARLARPPALAIGCGRQAALATRLLHRRHGEACRTVQILDPRIAPSSFDVLVVPAHDRISGVNVVTCTGSLNPVDDAWLAAARARFAPLARLPRPITLLALGGPTAHVRMTPRWFAGLAGILEQWLARDGGSLLITSSRRTPGWLVAAARHRFAGLPGRQWHGAADGENPYAGFLAHAERIVVTPDSANLMSEAAATGTPVLAYVPTPPRGKLAVLYRELVARGNVRPLADTFDAWTPHPLREMPRVAAAVRALLQPD